MRPEDIKAGKTYIGRRLRTRRGDMEYDTRDARRVLRVGDFSKVGNRAFVEWDSGIIQPGRLLGQSSLAEFAQWAESELNIESS